MPPIRRSPWLHISRLLVAAATAVVCVSTGGVATASAEDPVTTADTPAPVQAATAARAAPGAQPSADVARLFRFHAGAQANALRDAADRATFDETRREELKLLVREHLRRVEEELARVGAATPLDNVLTRAADLARDFNDREIATWLDEHPAVYQPVQEQIALAEAYERSVAEEPEAVLRNAKAAGLPPEREAGLRRLVTEAHERLRAADEADERRLSEAEAKAAAFAPPARSAGRSAPPRLQDPPQPPEGPGHADPAHAPRVEEAPVDVPQAGTAPAKPPPGPAPRPPTAEEEKLHLLDALTLVDAQARVAAAGREVRAEVEKLLPHPPQRKALADEMLRWYQTYAPPPEASDEPTAPDGATPQRPGPGASPPLKSDPRPRSDTRRVPSRFDPGF